MRAGPTSGAQRTTRRRVAAAVVAVVALLGGYGTTATVAEAQVACPLVPTLRDVSINQGLGSYPRLARGKETLVKLFLSLPACAPSGASIARTGGTLQVTAGATSATISNSTPAPTATAPPPLVPFAAGPALESTGDPTFVVPGPVLAPTSTTASYDASFVATINFTSKASSTAPAVPGVVTIATRPGTTTPIRATVEKRTNALRVLLVPMGDPTKTFSTQFSEGARAAAQTGMSAVSRLFPVPAGTSDLSGTTAGLRYTINPGLLDLRGVLVNGRFCGTGANFDKLKAPLAQTLLSWNTRNPTRPADRVLGLVDAGISDAGSCAEGFGAVGSTVGWVRAIPPTATAPSRTGALMAMELGHTLGLVPRTRSLFSDPYHSPNQQADVTAVNRGFNVSRRSFLSDDRSAMRVSGTWHQDSVLLERDDWSFLLCALGGAPGGGCTTSGTVGSSVGVGAEPTFVISGTTDGTPGGTSVVNSYFSAGVPRSEPAAVGDLTLVQFDDGNVSLRSDPIDLVRSTSEHHGSDDADADSPGGLFAAAVPFNTDAARIELRQGATVLYSRLRTAPPLGGDATVGPRPVGTTERVSLTDGEGEANADSEARGDISGDGQVVSFNSTATNLVAGDTNTFTDVFVRNRATGTTQRVSVSDGEAQANGASTEHAISANGRYVAFASDANNLVAGDTNAARDIFVRDLQAGTTVRASVSSTGVEGDQISEQPVLSADGRYVTFWSGATNFMPFDSPDNDVFRHDMVTGETIPISVNSAEEQATNISFSDDISPDGNLVVFQSLAENLTADPDRDFTTDVFVRDVAAGTTSLVSVATNGETGEAGSQDGRISADGRYVAFTSFAEDLIADDTNNTGDVFVRDRQAGTTTRVSLTSTGAQIPAFGAGLDAFSADGTTVMFTGAQLITPTDSGIYARDLTTGTLEDVMVDDNGDPAPGFAFGLGLSSDGTQALFTSDSQVLVEDDTEGFVDVFVRDRDGDGSTPPPGGQVGATGTDDNPQDARVDLFVNCGEGEVYPVAVGLTPEEITGSALDFEYAFDPAVACTGGQVSAVLNDGFTTATGAAQPVGDELGDRSPVAAIAQPTGGTTLTAYDAIPLRGSAKDPEDGELGGSSLSWTVDGVGRGTGPVVDVNPPNGGFSPGSHTAVLTAQDGAGNTDTASVTFTVLGDADNDGVPSTLEGGGCAGGSDANPNDGYADADGDGIGNADDMATAGGPCTAATVYAANVDVTPDTIVKTSTRSPLQAHISIPFRDVAAVNPSSVRIARIGGADVSSDARFVATSVTVANGVATATFDRPAVNSYLQANGGDRTSTPFTITGAATGGAWTFEGTDTIGTK